MKLLIVVDYQKDFVNGALPCGPNGEAIEERLCQKIREYEKNGLVMFTMDTHSAQEYSHSTEAKYFPPHCIRGTEGWVLYGETGRTAGETPKLIEKDTYGSFRLLDEIAQLDGLESIEMVGVATNVCVLHNAILVYNRFPDIPLTVDAACCASWELRLHDNALELLAGIGIKISHWEKKR